MPTSGAMPAPSAGRPAVACCRENGALGKNQSHWSLTPATHCLCDLGKFASPTFQFPQPFSGFNNTTATWAQTRQWLYKCVCVCISLSLTHTHPSTAQSLLQAVGRGIPIKGSRQTNLLSSYLQGHLKSPLRCHQRGRGRSVQWTGYGADSEERGALVSRLGHPYSRALAKTCCSWCCNAISKVSRLHLGPSRLCCCAKGFCPARPSAYMSLQETMNDANIKEGFSAGVQH